MAYDAVHKMLLLQEGTQTWQWDATFWLELNPSHDVSGQLSSGPEGQGVLSFGDYDVNGPNGPQLDSAQWSGTNWIEVAGTAQPLTGQSMIADGPTGIVFLSSAEGNETWVFAGPATQPPSATPEVPVPLLLPFSAIALCSAGYGVKKRRGRRRVEAAVC